MVDGDFPRAPGPTEQRVVDPEDWSALAPPPPTGALPPPPAPATGVDTHVAQGPSVSSMASAQPPQRGTSTSVLRVALVAGLVASLVGAVVAAVVTWGLITLTDDTSTLTVTGQGPTLDIQALLMKAQPSVVSIRTDLSDDGLQDGAGSGVVISEDGLVLTNAHVIGGATEITVALFDGTELEADLVGMEPADDIALIEVVSEAELIPAELGSSSELQVGDEVVAIGNALDLGVPSVTRGIVSAQGRSIEAPGVVLENLVQTDAAINPGNSGGPLVNARGEVVGISTAIIEDAQNIGFAIAIDTVKPLIDLISSGAADVNAGDAFLGVGATPLEDLPDEDRIGLGLPDTGGVFIEEIVPGSIAEGAGLALGDVIVSIDGDQVNDVPTLRDLIRRYEPGDSAQVEYIRDGDVETIAVELGRRGDVSG